MTQRRVGLWMIGAFGGVGTTAALGLGGPHPWLDRTHRPRHRPAPLRGTRPGRAAQFVVGGHDVRRGSFRQTVREMQLRANVFEPSVAEPCLPQLDEWAANVRPGTVLNAGNTITQTGRPAGSPSRPTTPRAGRRAHPGRPSSVPREAPSRSGGGAERRLDGAAVRVERVPSIAGAVDGPALECGGHPVLPASVAVRLGDAGPGLGRTSTSRRRWGRRSRRSRRWPSSAATVYGGKDGKTGETLLKTVLAPMFALRNWRILSWVGHNIFGNRDGQVLDDPANKASKIQYQGPGHFVDPGLQAADARFDRVHRIAGRLEDGLGPHPLPWLPRHQDDDAVHLAGLRFALGRRRWCWTWPGWRCWPSDAARSACLRHLACFFKSPMGVAEHDFFKQFAMLAEYAQEAQTVAGA